MGATPSINAAALAVELADRLLRQALRGQSLREKARARQVSGLIQDPDAKALSMTMTDRLIRSDDPVRAAAEWRGLLSRFGIPRGFGGLDRAMLALGAVGSQVMPGVVMRLVRARLRRDSAGVILPAEDPAFAAHLARRRAQGMRLNVNPLGEAILGEGEARRKLESLLALLARPDVDYVSVKISSIFSQINLAAWDATLAAITARLRPLYRAARAGGKFVNLDMEEYRDLELTMAAFQRLLDEPEFLELPAGIVLQAYLPDSFEALRRLTEWSRARVVRGGVAVKVRLVKGANLAMETVEAELHGWTPAPYGSKEETDANFRRMLQWACQPENAAVVRVGVGSHNLFDIALALVLREQHGVRHAVELEMLEGMANHQARAVRNEAGAVLLYAPVVKEKDFGSALAYLIRRLDENTAPENFLSDLFAFAPGSDAWERQKDRFLHGWERRHEVSTTPRRQTLPEPPPGPFHNEPDTDWTRPEARAALGPAEFTAPPAPLGEDGIHAVLATASAAQPAWDGAGCDTRAALLRRCADVMAANRFRTIALLRDEGKKAVLDADAEVSEAVDFARWYATAELPPASAARGVVVITPPWNFPFAIPCGGVLAALMAGNAVVLKPAPETVRLGWWLAEQLWQAGVPRDVLHFVTCDDGPTGRALVTDPRTAAVVLTGSIDTARMFLSWRPELPLFAETSGKNAIVVSAMADRDLAARDLVRSAFGHAGQKCSAASLGILEAEVYDDPAFRRQLRDAAASLPVGPSADPSSVVTPLIREAGPALHRALTTLDPGEEWLLEPRQSPEDPCLWSPGIKLGVARGSWFHRTECFGPVLGLMRATSLREAVDVQNEVPFGLTAGIHSLDEEEVSAWKGRVQAGNLYVNRGITGAIVRRQPFGGWKLSSVGPGAKAGGPNYVALFRRGVPADLAGAAASYDAAWRGHFSRAHDPSALRCESNVFRYRSARGVVLRLPAPDGKIEALAAQASRLTGTPLVVSHATAEPDAEFAARLPELARRADFLRTLAPPPAAVLRAAHGAGLNWIDAPFAPDGRTELTRWLREQSVTETRHRYGNVLDRR